MHHLLGQVIGHAMCIRPGAVGLEVLGAGLQRRQPLAQRGDVLLGGDPLALICSSRSSRSCSMSLTEV